MKSEELFVAANDREAAQVEELLDRERVAYQLDIVTRETGGACFQALAFKVSPEDVERCRRLLAASGLHAGVT